MLQLLNTTLKSASPCLSFAVSGIHIHSRKQLITINYQNRIIMRHFATNINHTDNSHFILYCDSTNAKIIVTRSYNLLGIENSRLNYATMRRILHVQRQNARWFLFILVSSWNDNNALFICNGFIVIDTASRNHRALRRCNICAYSLATKIALCDSSVQFSERIVILDNCDFFAFSRHIIYKIKYISCVWLMLEVLCKNIVWSSYFDN